MTEASDTADHLASESELPQLPPDNHNHTQFSWDAENGSMEASCARAVEVGLPSIAFTEHIDLTPWFSPHDPEEAFGGFAVHCHDGVLHAPELDVEGYFDEIERCRSLFPDLRILTGLELGEPHWWPEKAAELLAAGPFERVLGSLHSIKVDGHLRLIDEWFRTDRIQGDDEAIGVQTYLSEAISLIEEADDWEVFAHIDYLTRQIERVGRRHDPSQFEEEYRETLSALARSGRILEINTRRKLNPLILTWWADVGGTAVSFGSDAHEGARVAFGFRDAMALAEAAGFRRQTDPLDFWRRT